MGEFYISLNSFLYIVGISIFIFLALKFANSINAETEETEKGENMKNIREKTTNTLHILLSIPYVAIGLTIGMVVFAWLIIKPTK